MKGVPTRNKMRCGECEGSTTTDIHTVYGVGSWKRISGYMKLSGAAPLAPLEDGIRGTNPD